MHRETVQNSRGEKKRALIESTLKKFSRASALAGDEKRCLSFWLQLSHPPSFILRDKKRRERKRRTEQKLWKLLACVKEPETEHRSDFFF